MIAEYKIDTFYEIKATLDGQREVIYGGFDKETIKNDLLLEIPDLTEEGYTDIKIESKVVDCHPAPEVYYDCEDWFYAKSVKIDLGKGIAWAVGMNEENLYQVCLLKSEQGGLRRAVSKSCCDGSKGDCGKYNNLLGYPCIEMARWMFFRAVRKSGLKYVNKKDK